MAYLETRRLCRSFAASTGPDRRALDAIDLQIDRGSLTAIAGPSGAGKSTLLALLGGLDRPTSGDVLFDGRAWSECSEHEATRVRRRFGFVFQEFALIERLTVLDNVVYPLIPRGIPRAERQSRASRWLDRLGMGDRMTDTPRQLSGGQRQRVALARALAADPEIILADEPTSNLDPATSREIHALFEELHEAGRTIVVTTHDPVLQASATQSVQLRDGRLCTRGEE